MSRQLKLGIVMDPIEAIKPWKDSTLAMMLEAQAMDLYMRYAGKSEDQQVKEILYKMADEEKAHLTSLGQLLAKYAKG